MNSRWNIWIHFVIFCYCFLFICFRFLFVRFYFHFIALIIYIPLLFTRVELLFLLIFCFECVYASHRLRRLWSTKERKNQTIEWKKTADGNNIFDAGEMKKIICDDSIRFSGMKSKWMNFAQREAKRMKQKKKKTK